MRNFSVGPTTLLFPLENSTLVAQVKESLGAGDLFQRESHLGERIAWA
jgi:hypothetical protein